MQGIKHLTQSPRKKKLKLKVSLALTGKHTHNYRLAWFFTRANTENKAKATNIPAMPIGKALRSGSWPLCWWWGSGGPWSSRWWNRGSAWLLTGRLDTSPSCLHSSPAGGTHSLRRGCLACGPTPAGSGRPGGAERKKALITMNSSAQAEHIAVNPCWE